jgi:hypothetical protein
MTDATFDALTAELKAAVTFDDDITPDDGYNKAGDALWKAALAAFNWAAHEVGATGFQAGWAALRFYGEANHIDGPFGVLKAQDALFPQYNLPNKAAGWLHEWGPWLAEQARAKLAEYEAKPRYRFTDDDGDVHEGDTAHPDVVAHWRSLVAADSGVSS